jgi:Reverse transcriptase (RNA-dependent DNA polymerase)
LETIEGNDDSSDEEEPVKFVDAVEKPPAAVRNPPAVNVGDGNNVDGELAEFLLFNIDIINYEFGLVSASLGGGFDNINELKPMKYNVAMAGLDKPHWEVVVEEEKVHFDKSGAIQAKMRSELPPGTQVMDSTWACKKKSNGVFRAHLNLHGFCQVDSVHYDSHDVSSPVASIITIHIMLALIAILSWYASLVNVNGAFLLGDWESNREIYMDVPEGWEHHYPKGTVLKLLKTVRQMLLGQGAYCLRQYGIQLFKIQSVPILQMA